MIAHTIHMLFIPVHKGDLNQPHHTHIHSTNSRVGAAMGCVPGFCASIHHSETWRTIAHSAAIAIVLSLCFSCSDPNETRIRDACIAAGASEAEAQTPLASKNCSCVAAAAKKYLDKEDFELLAKVSSIYLSKQDEETKMHNTFNALVDAGSTPTKATVTIVDFGFLMHKVDRECSSGEQADANP